jgi:broad specificity phosphatase PhoE
MNITTNTLYLVRHGENPANRTKEFSYKLVDYSLNEQGQRQALQTAEFFKNIPLDAVYSSPLKRAHETANIIAQPHHLSVMLLEEFREVNVGHLELPAPSHDTLIRNWQLHDKIIREWVKGNHTETFPGGENFLTLLARSRRGLLTVIRGRSNQHILIAAHGGILAAIVQAFCQKTDGVRASNHMGNCAITEVELTTNEDKEEISGVMRCWASVTHLSGEAAEQVIYHLPIGGDRVS